ncbi:DUF3006 domain-containing protein [Zhaonella formicivorans]|jgi:hypothetical protein|uniref:DUF3006 domain-containing protein n=1 Tax=Zhaonella formicivorans TaxID=2528593 RepID=UPI0010D0E21B|nr:DUF3006 domain-containing protein [Zhaonella formicivorans]
MYVVDRFEGEFAVVSFEGGTFNLPSELLPPGSKEGDVLRIEVSRDVEKTSERAGKLYNLMRELKR